MTKFKIWRAPQRARSDTRETHRGFADEVEDMHGVAVRALRRGRNLQRFAPKSSPTLEIRENGIGAVV